MASRGVKWDSHFPGATMEAKLQSLKVPELKELLQTADLPVSGNKADLIKRLLENPKATASLETYVDILLTTQLGQRRTRSEWARACAVGRAE